MIDMFYELADAISGCNGRPCGDCYKHFDSDKVCPIDKYYEKAKREYIKKTNDWIEFKNSYPIAAAYLHGKFYCSHHNCADCKRVIGVDRCPGLQHEETQQELKSKTYNISVTDLENILGE